MNSAARHATGAQAYDLLELGYRYGTTNNNGNVLSQKITVKRPNQSDLVFDQLYTYDSLNRITSAEEKTGTTVNWNQTYTFDRYGNRNFNESLTTTLPKGCMNGSAPVVCEADKKLLDPALDPANNKMASGQGWSYDAAGNVIGDPQGRTFFYDAENKQVEVENSLEESIGKYWFDGDGKRIKKDGLAPNGQPELTVFVYDAGGKLIGEYSTNIETAAPKVQYLTADHLGSPRINTDQNGTVTSRTDYMPYGEEIIALGGRSDTNGYLDRSVRQGFTGYESDPETGLEFAQARVYRGSVGRFQSTDPLFFQVAMAADPQRFNQYVYTRNSPLVLVDPNGEEARVRGALTPNALYEMVGGQEEFDRYFEIVDGVVTIRSAASISEASGGVRNLAGLVNASEAYLFYVGSDFKEIADLFEGATNDRGDLTELGRQLRERFQGSSRRTGGIGTLVATRGRPRSDQQPAGADETLFAIFAYNPEVSNIQSAVSSRSEFLEFSSADRIPALQAQLAGLGQEVRASSFFIHEGAEAQMFRRIGYTNILGNDNYGRAHRHAMEREEQLRNELRLPGGFAGGELTSRRRQ